MQNYRPNCRPVPAVTQTLTRDTSEEMVLAMAYVPWQTWRNIYEIERAHSCGTIFQELDLPFLGIGGSKR